MARVGTNNCMENNIPGEFDGAWLPDIRWMIVPRPRNLLTCMEVDIAWEFDGA